MGTGPGAPGLTASSLGPPATPWAHPEPAASPEAMCDGLRTFWKQEPGDERGRTVQGASVGVRVTGAEPPPPRCREGGAPQTQGSPRTGAGHR